MARRPDNPPEKETPSSPTTQHITAIHLDASLTGRTELAHERQVAINDLIEWNHFEVKGADGPYAVSLKSAENRIIFAITSPHLPQPLMVTLPLAPFRSVIRDYFLICESYFAAVKTGNLARIEAIDMSRRGLHNEGADLLTTLISGEVALDSHTARRLFTLLSVLHLK